jgi:hypothetical protein
VRVFSRVSVVDGTEGEFGVDEESGMVVKSIPGPAGLKSEPTGPHIAL